MRPTTGLRFNVAASLSEVEEAWRLVYWAYRRVELINVNPVRVFTLPQALAPTTVVVTGRIGSVVASTLTVMADLPAGLPADRAFATQVQELRRQGRRPMELALFADRRARLGRTAEAFLELLRYAWHYGHRCEATDLLIGLRHDDAALCIELFGFQVASAVRPHPAMRHVPAVLMRLPLDESPGENRHPALRFLREPVDQSLFDSAFDFEPQRLRGSSIAEFMRDSQAPVSRAG